MVLGMFLGLKSKFHFKLMSFFKFFSLDDYYLYCQMNLYLIKSVYLSSSVHTGKKFLFFLYLLHNYSMGYQVFQNIPETDIASMLRQAVWLPVE